MGHINEAEARSVFQSCAWHKLRSMIFEVEGLAIQNLIWIEGCPGNVCYQIDATAGIDALLTTAKGQQGVYGLAFRSQLYGSEAPYKGTFTIRKTVASGLKTEIDKRLESLRNGSLTPSYMCHMYWRNIGGPEKSNHIYAPAYGAVAKTGDVLNALKTTKDPPVKKCYDGNTFYIVPFETVPNIHWYTWPNPAQEPATCPTTILTPSAVAQTAGR